jgi:hypothetical protein
VIVHGFPSVLGARRFGQSLSEHKDYKIKKPYFEIATENYKIVQIHKNLPEYIEKDLTKVN